MFRFGTAASVYSEGLAEILASGELHRDTREVVCRGIAYDSSYSMISWPKRQLNKKFMLTEAKMILTGDNRIEPLEGVLPGFKRFSDDGVFQAGAYGPAFVDQLPYILKTLTENYDSRQAVLTIWRNRPYNSKDIPCTLTLQFLSDRTGTLDLIVNMRSSDAFVGLAYDMYCFGAMLAHVTHLLNRPNGFVFIGAGSQHIYNSDVEKVLKLLDDALDPQSDDLFTNQQPVTFRDPPLVEINRLLSL